MSAIYSVLDQLATDASFLWGLRSTAVSAPHYNLADLAKLDGRVEAHIDGLRIAGEEGWELCRKELAWNDAKDLCMILMVEYTQASRARRMTALPQRTLLDGAVGK